MPYAVDWELSPQVVDNAPCWITSVDLCSVRSYEDAFSRSPRNEAHA